MKSSIYFITFGIAGSYEFAVTQMKKTLAQDDPTFSSEGDSEKVSRPALQLVDSQSSCSSDENCTPARNLVAYPSMSAFGKP